jgi:hypothetical protein
MSDERWIFTSTQIEFARQQARWKGINPYNRRRGEFSEPALTDTEPLKETAVCCDYYRHIEKLSPKSPLPLSLYCLIARVSNQSERFGVSLCDVAEYFGVDEKNLRVAKDKLVDAGWLIVVSEVLGKPTVFRAVTHDEWIKNPKNALTCCTKRSFNGDASDMLAKKIKSAIGLSVFKNVLKKWRASGFTDDEIYVLVRWRIHQEGETGWREAGRIKRIGKMMDTYTIDFKGKTPAQRSDFVGTLRNALVKAGHHL